MAKVISVSFGQKKLRLKLQLELPFSQSIINNQNTSDGSWDEVVHLKKCTMFVSLIHVKQSA